MADLAHAALTPEATPPTFAERAAASPLSTPALLSFGVMGIFALSLAGVFAMIFTNVKPDPVSVNLLLVFGTALVAAMSAVTGFWLANSLSSVQSSARKDAVIAASAVQPAVPVISTPTGPAVVVTETKDPAS